MSIGKFSPGGNRTVGDFSGILLRIPDYYDGDLKKSYIALCNYLNGLHELKRGEIFDLLNDISVHSGGYIGDTKIQKLFGIDFKRKFGEQSDAISRSGIPGFLYGLKQNIENPEITCIGGLEHVNARVVSTLAA